MKKGWYFVYVFLGVFFVTLMIQACATVAGATVTDATTKSKIFGFLNDINALNIVLVLISTFFGGFWMMGRKKIKQLSDILEDIYNYTDGNSEGGKKLSDNERSDIINDIRVLLGKATVIESTPAEPPKNEIPKETKEDEKIATPAKEKKKFLFRRRN